MFGLYLATTGISFGVFYLSTKAYGDYLKRMGYVDADGSKSTAELGFNIVSLGFKALIPGYNIYSALKILWEGSEHFEEMAADDLKKGSIRKLTDREINGDVIEEKQQPRIEEKAELKAEQIAESKTEQVVEQKTAPKLERNFVYKPYKDMTNEEKLAFLEQEKAYLLQQKENSPKTR